MNKIKRHSNKKIIFFEVNEVPYKVLDDYCKRHPDSAFAELVGCSHQYESYACASRPLEPCFNWPTVHRGIPDHTHGIYDWNLSITELDRRFPPFWKILASNGVRTGVFGSLHSHASFPGKEALKTFAFYVPDVFSPNADSYPSHIYDFQALNLGMVRKSGRNVDPGIAWQDMFKLTKSIPKLGLTTHTITDLAKQVMCETVTPWKKTRRRSYQAVLSFDIFFKLLRDERPDFATCFVNHVAASMHRYWAAAYPEDYTNYNVSSEWRERYKEEIDFAMNKTDKMLGKLIHFVKHNPMYTLVICSSMGQAATVAEHVFTELYIQDLPMFMKMMGVKNWSWSPSMFPHFNIKVKTKDIAHMRNALDNLRVCGKSIDYTVYPDGQFSLHLGQPDLPDNCIEFFGNKVPLDKLGLHRVVIEDAAQRTGYHIPEGTLLVYDPNNQKPRDTSRSRVSTLAIAPSLLMRFGVKPPKYMSDEIIHGIVDY